MKIDNKELLLKVEKLCKNFGPTKALDNVDLHVYRGEIRGLIGENGSGKSTISSIIAGIQPATSGEMIFLNKPHKPTSMIEAQSKGIGMIVQEIGTVSNISIAENIFLGRENLFRRFIFVNRSKMNKAAREALDTIGATDLSPESSINMLDMQERKLVELAKVMNDKPEIFIVDETTTALSQKGRQIIYEQMRKLKSENKAVLFISHDLEELISICDTLTVLRDGKLVANLEKEEMEEEKIKQLMVGREMSKQYYREDFDGRCNDEIVLNIENITTQSTLENFSMQLHRGEILGIGGLSHCGMHILGKAIFGAEKLISGRVIHNKTKVEIKNPLIAMKQNIGYVSKDRDKEALVLQASIKDNIAIGGLDKISLKNLIIPPKREQKYVKKQVEKLSIKCASTEQYVRYLSGGNKQKVVFGKWIGRDSEILILDCPTRGVDIGVKATMYQLLYDMKKEGKSIIMISEELPELIGMSDRLIIIKDGKETAQFKRSKELNESQIISYMI